MKGYLLAKVNWTDFQPLGIFTSKEDAQQAKRTKAWQNRRSYYGEVSRSRGNTYYDLVIYKVEMTGNFERA